MVGVGGGQDARYGQGRRAPGRAAADPRPDDRLDRRAHELAVGIYDDDGAFFEYRFYGRNPDVVLVDTAIIAQAPVRFLVAGIGDGLSTFFEADASSTTRKPTMAGGPPLLAATTLARLCYDTLLADGLAARHAAERGVVTPALDRVIEANTLLSGLGFKWAVSPRRIRSTTD